MTNNLLVIAPTRGRPENVGRLLANWQGPDILFGLDDDDPRHEEYVEIILEANEHSPESIWLETNPRLRMAGTLNLLANKYASEYPNLGFLGDDHLPRTDGWAQQIVDVLEHWNLGTGIAYGNDLFQGELLPTAVFMTSDIVKTVGGMVPPGFVHLYVDNVWKAWGEGMGRLAYLPDCIIEHLHPDANAKAPMDAGYTEAWTNYGPDADRWAQYQEHELSADIAKLRGLLHG